MIKASRFIISSALEYSIAENSRVGTMIKMNLVVSDNISRHALYEPSVQLLEIALKRLCHTHTKISETRDQL